VSWHRFPSAAAAAWMILWGSTAAPSEPGSPRAVVDDFSRMLESHHALEAIQKYVSEDYIEHDPATQGGDRAGLIKFIKDTGWDEPRNQGAIVHRDRTIASGELIVVHQHIRLSPTSPVIAIVDIFRVHAGKIVEHWDVSQEVPAKPVNTKYPMY